MSQRPHQGHATIPLRRLAEVIDCAHVTATFVDNDTRFPVASIRECASQNVDLTNCNYTTESFFQLLRASGRAPQAGDLLFVRNVSVGLVSAVGPDLPEFAVGQETVLIRRTTDTDPRFLRYALASSDVGFQIERCMVGSTFRRINVAAVRALRVPDCTHQQQRAIADYLDRELNWIDTLIEEQQRLIEMLRERREAVVRRSIPDHGLSHAMADKLGRNARIGNGSTPRREEQSFWTGGHIPWLNSAVVNQERVTAAEQFVTEEARAKCHLPLVPRGALLVALTGQGKTRGKATILDIEATINQHMAYVIPDSKHWNSEYLLWCLTAAYGELRSISDETGSTKGALTCEDLKRFRIVHVPLEEQSRIAAYLDEQTAKIDALIAETERFIEISRERRSALITAAVTGQIDVRRAA